MLKKCPHHGIPEWKQVEIFYDGVSAATRSTLDAAANGELDAKTLEECIELIEKLSIRSMNSLNDRQRCKGVYEIDTVDPTADALKELSKQIAFVNKKMDGFHPYASRASSLQCEFCGGAHANGQSHEDFLDEEAKVLGAIPK